MKKLFPWVALFVVGCGSGSPLSSPPPPPPPPGPPGFSGTFTYRNDNARTGQNRNETILTPATVDQARFGKVFSYPVDGNIYAQPLYVANVQVPGRGSVNVVYVATQHDSVYAFDADGKLSSPLWKASFINPVPSADVQCGDITPEVGITGTPVIDPDTGTLYVVAKTKENGNYFQRLHALNIATGAEKFGGPMVIQASVQGSQGNIPFDPLRENQRSALLLSRGVVYIAFASYCDIGPYHGWILGYNAGTLQQVAVFNTTPDGDKGGIWQSGCGLSADSNGNVYAIVGNGSFGGRNFGDSVLKLSTSGGLSVADFFTPSDEDTLSSGDLDLGSGGALILPDQLGTAHPHLLLGGGKQGILYLLDRDNLGQFHVSDQVVQAVTVTVTSGDISEGIFNTPAFWENTIYLLDVNDVLKAYRLLNTGLLSTAPTSQASAVFSFPGAHPVVSSNGSAGGIVWVLDASAFNSVGPAVLFAYDATDLTRKLYDSTQAGVRDLAGPAVKFAVPAVANGRVYVGTQNELTAYGPLP